MKIFNRVRQANGTNNLEQFKPSVSGQIVETKGYYEPDDGGGAKYIILTDAEYLAETGGAPDGYGDHQLSNGFVAKLIVYGRVFASAFGVGESNPDNQPALQACVNYAASLQYAVELPAGNNIFVNSTVILPTQTVLIGQGIGNTIIKANGNYTVFQVRLRVTVEKLELNQTSGQFEGIGFGTERTDNQEAQANHCYYKEVAVIGFDFSWWYRASIFNSFKDCTSRSVVGIRFSRNADPYDVTSDAPRAWNSFDPTLGWFNNVGTISNCLFEDEEVGIYGCFMSYHISGCTTQGQNGDKATNKILPVTEERTGVFAESGNTGVRNAWGNTVTSHYAEACRRPFYVLDQRTFTISTAFVQGGFDSNSQYVANIDANNSTVYAEGVTGQDHFEYRLIARNAATIYGFGAGTPASGSNPNNATDTSKIYQFREQEQYKSKYAFSATAATQTFEIPIDLQTNSSYELFIVGLFDGFSIRQACYDIQRLSTDALTGVQLRSGEDSSFTITIVGGRIQITHDIAQPIDYKVTLVNTSDSISNINALTAI
jgi:hypothetical protein